MKVITLFCLLLMTTTNSYSQNQVLKKNSIQLSTTGLTEYWVPVTVGYERLIFSNKSITGLAKVGGIIYAVPQRKQKAYTLEFNLTSTHGNNHWEAGVFYMAQDGHRKNSFDSNQTLPPWYSALQFGYRYQNPSKKFLFRVIGQTPMFRSVQIGADEKFKTKLKPAIEPWLNLSVGIPF